ncbi:hypothetical protein [Paenibacillus oleatilyticus]|uniref:hypothetical protein n=1 Tax=Paenibacillus oleatilyticus TaxID=2594886 RepID=UPI001C1F6601|nr:hypothetical protein [Paenibacillus oleatilyticus]MBU7319518.1 hypothetical protein [Paenibacillus oleatilyticus]
MYSVTLMEQYQATVAGSCFFQFLTLDSVRSRHLKEVKEVSDSEMHVLHNLTNKMSQLLSETEHHAQWLKEFVNRNPEIIEQIHQRLINDNEIMSEEQKQNWKSLIERNGGIVTYVAETMDMIIRLIPKKQEQLRSQNETNNRSVLALSGDCGFAVGVTIGLAAGGAWPLAVIGAAAAAIMCSLD